MRKFTMPTVQELMPLAQSPISFKGECLAALFALLPFAFLALLCLLI